MSVAGGEKTTKIVELLGNKDYVKNAGYKGKLEIYQKITEECF